MNAMRMIATIGLVTLSVAMASGGQKSFAKNPFQIVQLLFKNTDLGTGYIAVAEKRTGK